MEVVFLKITYKKVIAAMLFLIATFVSFKLINEFEIVAAWMSRLFTVLYPFTAGIIIAYLVNIPAKEFNKLYEKVRFGFIRKRSNTFAIISSYMAIVLIIGMVLQVVLPSIFSSLMTLSGNFQSYVNNAQDFLQGLSVMGYLPFEDISLGNLISPEMIRNYLLGLNLNFNDLFKQVQQILGISTVFLNTALAIIVSIYLLAGKSEILAFIHRLLRALFNDSIRVSILKYANEINYNFYMFIKCQIIDALIVGCSATLIFMLLGVQYALLLGFMIGLCNMIPYFGAIVASVVAIVLIAFSQGIGKAAAASVVLIIMQQIDGSIIQPRLLGGSLKISPVLIIFGITVGGAYFGVLGMIIAIPIVAVVKNIVNELISTRIGNDGEIYNTEVEEGHKTFKDHGLPDIKAKFGSRIKKKNK